MTKLPEKFTVEYPGNNGSFEVFPEEFHPYEPSAYVVDPGWTCYDEHDAEFFVSMSGDVFVQPENVSVGTVKSLVEAAERMEKFFDTEPDNPGEPVTIYIPDGREENDSTL